MTPKRSSSSRTKGEGKGEGKWRPVRRVKLASSSAEQGNSLPGKGGRQEGAEGLKLGLRSKDNAAHNLILPIKRNH